jgi:hypothetical protein
MTETFRIPKARFADEATGRMVTVMLPGAMPEDGAVHYDEALHKDRLICGCCSAKVHFSHGSEKILGGLLNGPRPHFRTNPGQTHTDCLYPLRLNEGRHEREYDKDKGYRIHLGIETIADHFNAQSLVHRDSDGRLVFHDPDLANREPYRVKSVKDIVTLIEKGNYARLRDSVVIHKGYDPIPWPEFFIRYDRGTRRREPVASPRFIGLTDKLLDRGSMAAFPVLMEMRFHRGIEPKAGYTSARGLSRAMFWGDAADERGGALKSHHIQPRLYLINPENKAIADAIPEAGTYLVLGHARVKTEIDSHHVTHFLDIRVTRADQVLKKDLAEIVATPQLPLGLPQLVPNR